MIRKINDLGKISPPFRWTEEALHCHNRGGVCRGCFNHDFFKRSESKQKCQMKASVLELVRVLGRPNKEETPFHWSQEEY